MNYRKGRINQKGNLSTGRWIERHRAKRTCRDVDENVEAAKGVIQKNYEISKR